MRYTSVSQPVNSEAGHVALALALGIVHGLIASGKLSPSEAGEIKNQAIRSLMDDHQGRIEIQKILESISL